MIKSVRIGIDASNICVGGGLLYLREILNSVQPTQHGIDLIVLWANSQVCEQIEERSWLVKKCPQQLEESWLSRRYWQWRLLPKALEENGCTVLFAPGGYAIANKLPVVTISQNLLPFELSVAHKYGFSWMLLRLYMLRWLQSRTFKKADGVIFLTEYARHKVHQATGKAPLQEVVIPHGVCKNFHLKPKPQLSLQHYSFSKPLRCLYVSVVDVYKHHLQVLAAVSKLRQQDIPVAIDFVGPAYSPAEKKFLAALNTVDAKQQWSKYHGVVNHEQLHEVYEQADIAIFASSCENLPIILLEKMAAALPIVSSNKGPMSEVLQKAAYYFNPECSDDIARALQQAINSPQQRQEQIRTNLEKIGRYSWESCAEHTFHFITVFSS